jgi:hypothetical protein
VDISSPVLAYPAPGQAGEYFPWGIFDFFTGFISFFDKDQKLKHHEKIG